MASTVKRKSFGSRTPAVRDDEALEFCALTERSISDLLQRRASETSRGGGSCRRRAQRWPFPGTVELWLPDGRGEERYALATSINLSHEGIGIQAEEAIDPGTCVQIAIHEPELTFHGRAIVRHCASTEIGEHLLGMQFIFEG